MNILSARDSIFLGIIIFLCAGCSNLTPPPPPSVSATATIRGTDGLGTAVTPIALTLTHDPSAPPSPRLAVASGGMQNVQNLGLTTSRVGIPPEERFYLVNITQSTFYPESVNLDLNRSAGDGGAFVERNIGDMVLMGIDIDSVDATIAETFSLPPVPPPVSLRLQGTSVLARVEDNDFEIPFNAPSSVIDMRRLTGGLFTALSAAVTGAIATIDNASLAGNGNFRMFFVPHTVHSIASTTNRNVRGFGYIFAFDINVGIDTAKIFIPISVLFEPSVTSTGRAIYQISVDPFDMIGSNVVPPDNLSRIAVYSGSAFVANTVRSNLVSSLSNLPQNVLDQIEDSSDLLTAGIDSLMPNNHTIPANFEIVALPQIITNQLGNNQVLPSASGIPFRLVILE